LVELLVSVVILSLAARVVVQGTNIASNSSRSSRKVTQISTLINRDLKWLGWYAQAWKCEAGACMVLPQPGVSLRYTSVPCNEVIARFILDASTQVTNPTRAFPIPNVVPTNSLPNVATLTLDEDGTSVQVTRTIRRSNTASISLEVTHTHADPPVNRFASVLIKAGSWCTP
jgi:hypothetical protein